ncbi:MAG: 3-hydroxyacyl-CoA dehydrogenase family protein, partial [Nitrospirae bacterium]|nr:3-hydroxyacyl-CoA dehydrogenase family protein [Nitrospirota bacterium]
RLVTQEGHDAIVCGRSLSSISRFADELAHWAERQFSKGKLSREEAEAIRRRLSTSQSLGVLGSAEFIIEAVAEALEAKRGVFRQLGEVCAEGVPLASNTSSIPIEYISNGIRKAGQIIGVHFMNPAYVMHLVEVVPCRETSPAVTKLTIDFLASLGKDPVLVPDKPGFVLNRILFASLRQAMELLEEEGVDAALIDKIMKLGANHPMGPLELADFIGLDICLAIFESLQETQGVSLAPPSILKSLVDRGRLGRKSGEGFYRYASG